MSLVDEFLSSGDIGWELTNEQYAWASTNIKDPAYLLVTQKGCYIINRDYIKKVILHNGPSQSNNTEKR